MTLIQTPRSVVQITVLVLLAECASPVAPIAPAAPNVEVARELFQWTFANASNGPATEDSELTRSRYTSDGLEFVMLKPGSLRFTPRMDSVRDMRVEADFEFTSAAPQGDNPPSLGVICRAQPSQWFFLRVVANGDVSAYRIRGESADDWLRVPASGPQTAIARGPVHVRADCFSNPSGTIFLSFYVNGVQSLSAHDSQPGPLGQPGRGGIMMSTGEQATATFVFRNFRVQELRTVSP